MPYYFSQTDNAPVVERNNQTTSAATTKEVRPYEFNKMPVNFTATSWAEENIISVETEKKFYKKAFETKSL